MPKLTKKLPSYRLHKPTGQPVVTLDGRDHYLCKFGTPKSLNKYKRLVGEWNVVLAQPAVDSNDGTPAVNLRVSELFLAISSNSRRSMT